MNGIDKYEKEKGNQLIDKFGPEVALKVVDEILSIIPTFSGNGYNPEWVFYKRVRVHISLIIKQGGPINPIEKEPETNHPF